MLIDVDGYEEKVIALFDPKEGAVGEVIEIQGIYIALPPRPLDKEITGYKLNPIEQFWKRGTPPSELLKVKSMEEWGQAPPEFRKRHRPYIEEEFRRRREGYWFFNNGTATYITGRHYMLLQWSRLDIGDAYFLNFQREIYIHMAACEADPRCMGQIYTKCRRSGYTNMCSAVLVDEGTQVKDKLLGIQSKTGKDAQENIFMKKAVFMYRSYPFFFKPIQDGTTNPRMELAFREPSKRITKKNTTTNTGEALNTVINWKSTTNNAYDGEKLHMLYLDEAGKWEKPTDIREAWRIERTCLIVGRRIIGKALVGSTVNPMDKGGQQYKGLWDDSNPEERNANGRTISGLYRIFIPAHDALEGFFDRHGNPIVNDPEGLVETLDGEKVSLGAKTFLKNERDSLKGNARELNEFIRQFPFTPAEAFRDSVESTLFDIGKIYQQIEYNNNLYPDPIVRGNFVWAGGQRDTKVVFQPSSTGRWRISWLPSPEDRSIVSESRGKKEPSFKERGCGGVDSYDLDATVDNRGSKGACHIYNKFNMAVPSNMFVAEYVSRPPMAKIFYEDVLMAAVYYGYPLLIENNKYGIVRYFEERGYDGYVMDRPEHLYSGSTMSSKTKGIPSNSQEIIQAHAHAIEDYIHNHVGLNTDGEMGSMLLNRTLEDWVGYKIDKRTKFDLTVSSGLALLAAQKAKAKKPMFNFEEKRFFRRYSTSSNGLSTPK